MIIEHDQIKADLTETADVVIIGSGVGGMTVAQQLAQAGHKVVVLERGGYYSAARGDLDQRSDNMLARIDGRRGLGTSTTGEIALMYGNCVGGASVHYWADSWRLPKDRADRYVELGVEGHEHEVLEPIFDRIEKELNVHLAGPDYYNRMNQLFDIGAKKLGWSVEGVPQARRGCAKSGHCYQGCSYDAKQSALVTSVPAAIKAGTKLYSDCDVTKITLGSDGKANGVEAEFLDRATGLPKGHKLSVKARIVVLAAGGFASAAIWLRSKLPNGSGQVGKNLYVNPCPYLYAVYDEPVVLWENIPTATGTQDFRLARYQGKKYVEGGYLLHPNQIQPEFLAATLPGFGIEHAKLMERLPYIGSAVSWVDDEMPGQIILNDQGKIAYDYVVRGVDLLKTRDALKKQAMLLFASGAREVIVPDIVGTRLRDPDQISVFDTLDMTGGNTLWGGPHPAGALRMGKDPNSSVVGSDHQAHEVPGLYVADPSAFPVPPSVDPSLTIMAWSVIAANAIQTRLG
ncbi:MAG: GMC family oxidoreductase [Sphingopyxis sp.]|nr:GMC family oxidoreductase [Sphingopyxis sp.]